MRLGDRLAELRKERGLTLRELRELLEQQTGEPASISYLSELERSQAVPSIETVTRLAHAYGLSLQDLLAPVDAYMGQSTAQYPKSLRDFAAEHNLSNEWVETLARVEHRGKRPDNAMEWQAIYGMLRALLEPKLSRRG
jgi:transcriptional regulator with XRE-family HTH domain